MKWFGMIPFSLSIWSHHLRSSKSGAEVSEQEEPAMDTDAETRAEAVLEEPMDGLPEEQQPAEGEQSEFPPRQWQPEAAN